MLYLENLNYDFEQEFIENNCRKLDKELDEIIDDLENKEIFYMSERNRKKYLINIINKNFNELNNLEKKLFILFCFNLFIYNLLYICRNYILFNTILYITYIKLFFKY
jgi:hypothetical protein